MRNRQPCRRENNASQAKPGISALYILTYSPAVGCESSADARASRNGGDSGRGGRRDASAKEPLGLASQWPQTLILASSHAKKRDLCGLGRVDWARQVGRVQAVADLVSPKRLVVKKILELSGGGAVVETGGSFAWKWKGHDGYDIREWTTVVMTPCIAPQSAVTEFMHDSSGKPHRQTTTEYD